MEIDNIPRPQKGEPLLWRQSQKSKQLLAGLHLYHPHGHHPCLQEGQLQSLLKHLLGTRLLHDHLFQVKLQLDHHSHLHQELHNHLQGLVLLLLPHQGGQPQLQQDQVRPQQVC